MERTEESRFSRIPFFCTSGISVLLATVLAVAGIETSGRPNPLYVGGGMGLIYGQVLAAAVALSLLPIHMLARTIAGVLSIVFLCGTMAIFMRDARPPVPLLLAAVVFAQWIVYQVPLVSFRMRGWSLSRIDRESDRSEKESQFGLQQIFIWTAVVAVFLGVARLTTSLLGELAEGQADRLDISIFFIQTLGNSVAVLPLIWGAFIYNGARKWLTGALIWACIISAIEMFLLSLTLPLSTEEWWLFAFVNVVQFLSAAAILYSIRFAGFRLQQRPKT